MGLEMRKRKNRTYEISQNRCTNWCGRKTKLISSRVLYFIYLTILLEQLYAITHRVETFTPFKCYTINNFVLGEVKIHVGGPLNLTRGCICERENVLLYKMRISAEVKRKHNEIFENSGWAGNTIIKQPTCDSYVMVPNPLYTSKELEYMQEYYNILFLMFQGEKKYASEFERKTNRFYKFLSSLNTTQNKADHTLLASLFLLAEGLNIPLKFLKNDEYMHLTLQKNQSNDFHFNFYREEIDASSAKGNRVYLKVDETDEIDETDEMCAYDIVNFFIKHTSNPVIEKAGYVEPKTYEEYKTRKFINSPGFLIQNYVYYYLDSIEEMKEFIKTVHDLLCEYLPDKEAQEMTSIEKTAIRIFNRCFISSYNKNSTWEGVQLEELSESIWNSIENLGKMNTIYENSITGSLTDSDYEGIERAKNDFAVLFNRTFIQYMLSKCFFILAEKIRISEISINIRNNIQVEDFIKITEQKNLEFDVFGDNFEVNCTFYLTIVTALFAKAIYNNLDKDHEVVQLAANAIWLDMKNIYKTNTRLFTFAIIASIYEQSRESNPKIFLENNIYLMRYCSDRQIMNNVSFILTYLIYKDAPHAIIRFIKSYMVVRRKFKFLTLTNLILWHLSQTEAKNLLLCLTRNFTTTEYIQYAFMSVQKIEDKKSRENLVADMNEFILLLHNIATQNGLEFKNIANESYITTIQSSIKEISTPNTDQNTCSFLLNSMQMVDTSPTGSYARNDSKGDQIVKTLYSIYNRNTSENKKLNLMGKIEGTANNIIYILNSIEEFYCKYQMMGALIACNPYVNTDETTKAQYNEIRDEFMKIHNKSWDIEEIIYTIFTDNQKKICDFFKTLIDLGVDGALKHCQKFNDLYTRLVNIRKQGEYKLEAEIFLQLFKMDDLKKLNDILKVLTYLHNTIYRIDRDICSCIQIITAHTYRKEKSIIPKIEEITIKVIALASKIHNEIDFQMGVKIIPGKTTGIDEIKDIVSEITPKIYNLEVYMRELA
ncbi:hypothetical protein NEIRO03_0876 [Nematocida sp. AWRm78]|nr:hypothetical protein NEIRO02_2468 [Nematocida sp. AWRm79]KAI5183261.1 hypothetical protein NEIRO03_0876 [Nematocida sp. AWRm78]